MFDDGQHTNTSLVRKPANLFLFNESFKSLTYNTVTILFFY